LYLITQFWLEYITPAGSKPLRKQFSYHAGFFNTQPT
jgi:hypothetical protein